ncbi:leucyl aminopeptidase (aminopeptidase T) [Murinocardiopsis flavida]|uniref:Leucyl aminopeptidase (Aminopeptidase T) n=1 Tax=Murinocardiopsis flavida TaxID=645275 RepID=A0A2P8CLY5_9ACTN|nr:leucyl aminopeptidase [Murinocardiopsis flavida]PSK85967.1 leucyl aminopeptidase (aminopeptidase T) [Murinocardiopsis flavida]
MVDHFLLRPAHRILEQCLALRDDETLLVLTDSATGRYGAAFAAAGHIIGAEVVELSMTPRSRHGEEPPAPVAAAMAAADAIVAPTTFSVNHSSARIAASAAGARLIFMPDVCDEVFLDGSLDIDFLERKGVIDRLAAILDAGSEYTVTSPAGTNLTARIAGKSAVPQSGICHEPGTISPPPCIEVAIAPDEGTLDGVMVVDGALVPGGPTEQPVTIRFAAGRITDIDGGPEAARFREVLESYGDPEMYSAVELGLGMNPKARIGSGGGLEDEAELGTMHVGIGNGITFGSSIRAPGHCDIVTRDARVCVDGRVILANGAPVLPDGSGTSAQEGASA